MQRAEFLQRSRADADARARLLRFYLRLTGGSAAAIGLLFVFHTGAPWHGLVGILGGLWAVGASFLVGRTLSCRAAFVGTVGLLVACSSHSIGSGGLDSPFSMWIALLPFMAVLLGGTAATVPASVAAAICIVVVGAADSLGWCMPSIAHPNAVWLAQLLSTLVAVAVAAYVSRYAWFRTQQWLEKAAAALSDEVDHHEKTRASLDTAYGEMLQIARRAGMGEVATGVLHNVGNALNGVNTSVALAVGAVDRVEPGLERIAQLLRGDLDPERRSKLADYVERLDASRAERRAALRAELVRIRDAADHVGAIIRAQQQLATSGSVIERVSAREIVAQSRLLLDASLARHEVTVDVGIPDGLMLTVDRHRVVQILTNLIGNARDALRNAPGDRRIDITAHDLDGIVAFDVMDTGPGVPDDLREAIFTHGFTTKDDGHGFGLHASALAAVELGGQLTLEAGGPGAHFQLRVPLRPPSVEEPEAWSPTSLTA